MYSHLSMVDVSAGDTVAQGQAVGLVGSTGVSTGDHIHYETRVNGICVDPLLYYEGYAAAW